MTLKELQDILGDQINSILNLNQDDAEGRNFQMEKSEMIARLAKSMINNADVVLRADKLAAENRLIESTIMSMVK